MGTIVEKATKAGTKYKALVRVNREGYPPFSKSKTFSNLTMAKAWIKKLEAQIELDSNILMGEKSEFTLAEAIDKYLSEVGSNYSRSKIANLKALQLTNLANIRIDKLTRVDFSSFASARLLTVKPQTLAVDFVDLRSVLKRAVFIWGATVDLTAFEEVVAGLRYARQIRPSNKRTRLPTTEELIKLTNYFRERKNTATPMHLIIWFAIYSGRRQNELAKMFYSDFDAKNKTWIIRDTKSAAGKGNHIKVKMTDKALAIMPLIEKFFKDNQHNRLKSYDTSRLMPICGKSLSSRFTDACKDLGIEDLRFHDLRHEAATRLAEQGLSIPQIQQVTGHKSWSALQIYVNMDPREGVIDYLSIWQD